MFILLWSNSGESGMFCLDDEGEALIMVMW